MKKLVILLSLILIGCSGVTIKNVQKADTFTLSKYKTFGFFNVDATGDGLGKNYTANLESLKKAISKQFEAKGLSLAPDNPDIMVNIGIVVSQEVQTRETSFSDPADRTAYMGQRNYSWHSQEVVVGKYKQGSVTLDLVDRESGKLVWQGTATSVVPENQKNVPALIEEGMTKLFLELK
jgi:PBP1b-binding outer membrane lipoprotein LpoB